MWQYNQNELYHHGVKGQKWYVRRYQNSDGTLTAEGRKRYGASSDEQTLNRGKYAKDASKSLNALDQDRADAESNLRRLKKKTEIMEKIGEDPSKYKEQIDHYTKNLKVATKEIDRIKSDLKRKNYSLNEQKTVRLSHKGAQILKGKIIANSAFAVPIGLVEMALGPIGTVAVGLTGLGTTAYAVATGDRNGTKYKVKK